MSRKYYLLLVSLLLTTGCQVTQVEPWERDILSVSTMVKPSSNLNAQLAQHIYFSKEGSSGSSRASAGGCGCN